MLEKRKGIPSFKGKYVSKHNEMFRYDSLSELAMMLYLDNVATNVLKWHKNTKLRIPYVYEGKERKYIPDFIVEFKEVTKIIEIKGSDDKPELRYKIMAGNKYCLEHNIQYELIAWDKVKTLVDWTSVKTYHNINNK
jgi:hypothetical protein